MHSLQGDSDPLLVEAEGIWSTLLSSGELGPLGQEGGESLQLPKPPCF